MFTVLVYITYLVISIAVTIGVARTLFRHGRPFVIHALNGNVQFGDSLNHLLAVPFYLISIGYVALALKISQPAETVEQAIEFCSMKVGYVLIVLGVMHVTTLFVFAVIHNHGSQTNADARRRNAVPRPATGHE